MKALTRMTLANFIIGTIIVAIAGYYWYVIPPKGGGSGEEKIEEEKTKIAILFGVEGRGDLSLNDMAYLGAEKAAKDFGVEIKYLTPKSTSDMVPLLE